MTKRIALIGASGHGKVIADIASANGMRELTFYDDRWPEIGNLYDIPVVGDIDTAILDEDKYDSVYITIGNARTRSKIQALFQNIGPALVHPTASVSPSAVLGVGTVVMPHAVVNAEARVGRGVILNSGSIIEHDCVVGDYAHICPRAAIAGGVNIGSLSWIGIGSSVIQMCSIGQNAMVGVGAVVIRNVLDNQTVVGNPARPLNR